MNARSRQSGLTYVEILITLAIGALLLVGLSGVVGRTLQGQTNVQQKHDHARQARFAMQRMVRAVSHTRLLLLPLNDMPLSNWQEHIREEILPPTTPTDDSTRYTAVSSRRRPESSQFLFPLRWIPSFGSQTVLPCTTSPDLRCASSGMTNRSEVPKVFTRGSCYMVCREVNALGAHPAVMA